jgi:NitT/TauT family transport system substrate-binding protein
VLDTSLTVLALDMDMTHSETTLVKRFIRSYAKAVETINEDPESFKETLVTKTRFPKPAGKSYRVPVFPPVGVPSEKDVADAQAWLEQKQMVGHRLPYSSIVMQTVP